MTGKRVDAIAQTTKSGLLFVFDRSTGEPLFPIREVAVPPSTVPGEVASLTQPLPTLPAPYAQQSTTEDTLTTRTPEAHAWALKQFRSMISGGQFASARARQINHRYAWVCGRWGMGRGRGRPRRRHPLRQRQRHRVADRSHGSHARWQCG